MTDAPHPGKTKAQRRVLDAIGCGDFLPPMSARTRDALLKAGLICKSEPIAIGKDRFGVIKIPQFYMPLPVHIQWCQAVAFTDEEMTAFEAGEK